MYKGTLHRNTNMMMGPDSKGRSHKVQIAEIWCKMVPVRQVKAGQLCSLKI
jgi:GTPase